MPVDRGADEGRPCRTSPTSPGSGFDVAAAVDLVMLGRGLPADDAYELIRMDAEQSGRDLHAAATDIIDLGTSRLPRGGVGWREGARGTSAAAGVGLQGG